MGRDSISGGGGRDHIVGDNLRHESDATGGRHDEVARGERGPGGGGPNRDRIIGDSAVLRLWHGARREEKDHICAEKGRDLVVGDSYSPRGSGPWWWGRRHPERRPQVRHTSSVTATRRAGVAIGNGHDRVHGLWGSDLPASATTTPPAGTGKSAGGGGGTSLTGASGDDRLRGGPRRDICAGGTGRDRARACEHRLHDPLTASTASPRLATRMAPACPGGDTPSPGFPDWRFQTVPSGLVVPSPDSAASEPIPDSRPLGRIASIPVVPTSYGCSLGCRSLRRRRQLAYLVQHLAASRSACRSHAVQRP